MADITESSVRQFIAEKLGDDSDILATEHREVENKIMDYVVQEFKKVAKSKVLILESFTTDRNYSLSTELPTGSFIDSVVVMLVCKVSNNGFSVDDCVTAPTPYPQDSGRTSAQGIGVQYSNLNPSTVKVMVNDQITIMTAYNSAPNAVANNVIMSGTNLNNWELKIIVGYK
ncbi:hypothetical protein [Flavobacterium johnsoniae]|uniref:Uncharacterized protein n=1 Tax=Flavobacterium johnsoniae TaxID=986 RepID=A0A1M5IHW1_FLAJO|nr:hypothetical protein [Flavobacterium johnsoniae]SHG27500.1 hypothetical protein SAMN05444388_10295 [Flavobacterium johnsoniae]